ncbi:MAG: hypothetical protein R3C97_10890 [Geminicoccaceae bacterium]
MLLTSCEGFDPSLPERPAAPVADASGKPADFPDLANIPARPNLSYDLRQEREIQQGLVADRENARYRGQQLRREAGLRQTPPDPAVPQPAPVRQPVAVVESPADPSTLYVEEAIEQDQDDGSLGDFLDSLERRQDVAVASPAPEPLPAAGTQAARPAPTPEERAPGPETAAETDYGDLPVVFLSPPDEDGPLPEYVRVDFANGSDTVDPDANEKIRSLAVRLQRAGKGARVVASGDPPILALDRARAVAIRLVRHGIPGNWIDIETGGTGSDVVVYPEASGG